MIMLQLICSCPAEFLIGKSLHRKISNIPHATLGIRKSEGGWETSGVAAQNITSFSAGFESITALVLVQSNNLNGLLSPSMVLNAFNACNTTKPSWNQHGTMSLTIGCPFFPSQDLNSICMEPTVCPHDHTREVCLRSMPLLCMRLLVLCPAL